MNSNILNPFQCRLLQDTVYFGDVGAANGIDDPWLYFWKQGNVHTVGFEPNPDNYEKIKGLKNSSYHQLAISDKRGRMKFYLDHTYSSLIEREIFDENIKSIEVDVETIEHLRETETIPKIDFLKVDAEEVDHLVLLGAGKYLKDEILGMKSEFTFFDMPNCSFNSIDQTMRDNGFILFDIAFKHTNMEALSGGDVIYFKNIYWMLEQDWDRAYLKNQICKLITLCIINYQIKYAYYCVKESLTAGVFSEDEASELTDLLTQRMYIPNFFANFPGRIFMMNLMFLATRLFSSIYHVDKSTPYANRCEKSTKLWWNRSLIPSGWQKKYKKMWDDDFEIHKKYTHYYNPEKPV